MQVTQRTLAEVQERVGRAGEIHGGDLQIQRRAASSRDRSQREVHP
jgi:hypothetical protein